MKAQRLNTFSPQKKPVIVDYLPYTEDWEEYKES